MALRKTHKLPGPRRYDNHCRPMPSRAGGVALQPNQRRRAAMGLEKIITQRSYIQIGIKLQVTSFTAALRLFIQTKLQYNKLYITRLQRRPQQSPLLPKLCGPPLQRGHGPCDLRSLRQFSEGTLQTQGLHRRQDTIIN